jgi:hypothetical protein
MKITPGDQSSNLAFAALGTLVGVGIIKSAQIFKDMRARLTFILVDWHDRLPRTAVAYQSVWSLVLTFLSEPMSSTQQHGLWAGTRPSLLAKIERRAEVRHAAPAVKLDHEQVTLKPAHPRRKTVTRTGCCNNCGVLQPEILRAVQALCAHTPPLASTGALNAIFDPVIHHE